MVTFIRALTAMVNLMVRAFIRGLMVNAMMGSGKWVLSMALACGRALAETPTSDSGSMLKLRGTGYMFGKTKTSTKGNGSKI